MCGLQRCKRFVAAVFRIDIQHPCTNRRTGWHADHSGRIAAPVFANDTFVQRRATEPVACERGLGGEDFDFACLRINNFFVAVAARKDWPVLRLIRQRDVEHWVGICDCSLHL